MIKTVATITDVEHKTTRTGKDMVVVHDDQGREYSSFVPDLMRRAEELQGRQVAIGYDEQQKGQFTNRYLRVLSETNGTSTTPVPDSGPSIPIHEPGRESNNPVQSGETASTLDNGAGSPDWLAVVRQAAQRGEWRAAESLVRRRDISRSVALNNTIVFFQYLDPESRKPENVKLVFDYMLKALEEA